MVNGKHFNSGCCFDYGNAETDSRDDDAGTMETTYFGDANVWYHGNTPGPWIMTDQENNLVGCVNQNSHIKASALTYRTSPGDLSPRWLRANHTTGPPWEETPARARCR